MAAGLSCLCSYYSELGEILGQEKQGSGNRKQPRSANRLPFGSGLFSAALITLDADGMVPRPTEFPTFRELVSMTRCPSYDLPSHYRCKAPQQWVERFNRVFCKSFRGIPTLQDVEMWWRMVIKIHPYHKAIALIHQRGGRYDATVVADQISMDLDMLWLGQIRNRYLRRCEVLADVVYLEIAGINMIVGPVWRKREAQY